MGSAHAAGAPPPPYLQQHHQHQHQHQPPPPAYGVQQHQQPPSAYGTQAPSQGFVQPQPSAPPAAGGAAAHASLGSPAVEYNLEGQYLWGDIGQPQVWSMQVMVDSEGNVFGGNRADGLGMTGRFFSGQVHTDPTTQRGVLNVREVYESGTVIAYTCNLPHRYAENGSFSGNMLAEADSTVDGIDGRPPGTHGTVSGTISRKFVSAVEFKVGGGSGWYAWAGEPTQAGFEMHFTVDRVGNVYGGNKNLQQDAERKEYRGTFKHGELSVEAVFESGAVIRYAGRVMAGMQWSGHVEVVTAGTNVLGFKPVGTRGTVGGAVSIRRAESRYAALCGGMHGETATHTRVRVRGEAYIAYLLPLPPLQLAECWLSRWTGRAMPDEKGLTVYGGVAQQDDPAWDSDARVPHWRHGRLVRVAGRPAAPAGLGDEGDVRRLRQRVRAQPQRDRGRRAQDLLRQAGTARRQPGRAGELRVGPGDRVPRAARR
jgi:hypothetical protein